MKATITILLLAFVFTSCSKAEDAEYRAISLNTNSVPSTVEDVKAALIGTWTYEGEKDHYVTYGADGIRCIGYAPDSLNECMKYDVFEEDGTFKIGVYAIGNVEGTGDRYCMVATVENLTDMNMQYQSTVYRSLLRVE